MVGSVMNEGLRGMQNSQRELQRAATDIARANITERSQEQASDDVASTLPAVEEPQQTSQRSIEESLVELRRQEQLFTANAKVVSVANQALGSLIDVKS